ncbi:hypothetical protein MZT56_27920, partial [Escherichia coli]
LTIAEINEPRFEKEGLLIEGQRTNYLKNSNTPELWYYHSLLAKEYGVDNYGFNYATVTVTDSLVGTTSSYQIHSVTGEGNDSNLLIVFYVQIMPDDFVMQLHRF